jgi:hypothetical protein
MLNGKTHNCSHDEPIVGQERDMAVAAAPEDAIDDKQECDDGHDDRDDHKRLAAAFDSEVATLLEELEESGGGKSWSHRAEGVRSDRLEMARRDLLGRSCSICAEKRGDKLCRVVSTRRDPE